MSTLDQLLTEYGDEIRRARAAGEEGWGRKGLMARYGLTEWMARLLAKATAPSKADTAAAPPKRGKVTVEHHEKGHATASGGVRTLDELLDAAGVDRKTWRVVSWQARAWDAAVGDGIVRTMHYVRAALERRRIDLVTPVVHPIPVRPWKVAEPTTGAQRVLCIPDAQVGHRRITRAGREVLVPMHDRRAMDAVWQVAERDQPETIILLGDMLDLTELTTKYPKPLEVLGTVQPSIVELAWWLRDLRERCPTARIMYIEGNHEHRLSRMVTDKARELGPLQAVDDDRPALSVARLLGLDALAIEYVGPFGRDAWLWADTDTPVRIHHGEVVRSKGGQTVAAQLQREQTSIIGGHVHRVECAWATDHGPHGRRTRLAMSPGCLCRVDSHLDGGVPGVSPRPDWQQGWGWLARTDTGGLFGAAVPVVDGVTVWRGEVIEGRDETAIVGDVREGSGLFSLVEA